MKNKKETILIALGGNALIQKGQKGTAEEQIRNLKKPLDIIAKLSREYRIVITHGNGPQVGNLLLQQESCDAVPKMPLDVVGAESQGQIGYLIESTLDTALMNIGIENSQPFATLITYTVVDQNDPLFQNPTKPVGPFYTKEQAEKLPYRMVETIHGYRRVVASPKPVDIINHREVKTLIDMNFIVICCGGGGIPVIREGKSFQGVDAVIDKDLASSLLASEIDADLFIVATDEKGVYVNFGKPDQKFIETMTVAEARKHISDGQFPAGSMKPKVESAVNFAEATGKRAVITALDDILEAVAGKSGTAVIR
ncbi:MAG: carbamate kinase [Desulfobacterales bacterium]|nr:carbamate kinase [Desulfobacterales bacterium]MDD4072677.1 carbamate kinase [Desulfobacterales bacterium]MDD4391870.1 carbamate kinase [Desulfobacterales bacterium]